jgi:hypothetical protein
MTPLEDIVDATDPVEKSGASCLGVSIVLQGLDFSSVGGVAKLAV